MEALDELRTLVARLAARDARFEPTLPRLHLGHATRPTSPTPLMTAATVALVVQGVKRTGLGTRTYEYGSGEVLVTSVRVPLTTQVSRATVREPFLGVGLTLDPALVASVLLKAPERKRGDTPPGVSTSAASPELLDAFRRYVRLLDAPGDVPLLGEAIEREIVWRVLQSPLGAALHETGMANSASMRVSRAIERLQTDFAGPLAVANLARTARMSLATFNRQFRKVTAMSPLQFQKLIRLQEARAQLLSRAGDVGSVAFTVGYQSPAQFSRDYRRQFGLPPSEDAAQWRRRAPEAF